MGVSSSIRVMSRVLLGVVLAGATVASLQAQEAKTMLAMPPTPLLPEALRTGPDHDAGNGAPSWSGADGAVLVEDGIKRYERGTAQSPVALSGVSVVVSNLKLYPESAGALLKNVQVGLPKVGGPKGLPPLLPTYLPEKGLEKETVKYSLGPVGYEAMGGV